MTESARTQRQDREGSKSDSRMSLDHCLKAALASIRMDLSGRK